MAEVKTPPNHKLSAMYSLPEQAVREHFAFFRRLAVIFAITIVGYVLTLEFVYPLFFAPFAAVHSDMYIAADMAARGLSLADMLFRSRPVSNFFGLLGGDMGFQGSLVFFTSLTLVAIALSVALAERYLLRAKIPWGIVLATVAFAMAGPSFYGGTSTDVGTSVAMLFGLLGIYCWESRVRTRPALIWAAAMFCLSVLAKEGFLPVIGLYCAVEAYRTRQSRPLAIALLALPLIAALVLLFDSQYFHSPFVNLAAGAPGAYGISLNPLSMLHALWYYASPLVNIWIVSFIAVCVFAARLRGRGRAAAFVLAASMATYLPYMLLPNHLVGYYAWVPMPILMLLIPLAWVSNPAADEHAEPATLLQLLPVMQITRFALAILFLGTLTSLNNVNAAGNAWTLQQQAINRNIMEGLRWAKPQLAVSRSVLVCGMSYPFHPWVYGEFLAQDLPPNGLFTVVTHPPGGDVAVQPHVRPLTYAAIRWDDYDLVLIFDAGGTLVGAYRPTQFEALAKKLHVENQSPFAVIDAVRGGKAVPR